MRKTAPFAYSLILIVLLYCGTALIKGDSPEDLIVGKWEEVDWNFERINVDSTEVNGNLLAYQKNELYNNMIIHQGEEWEFFLIKRLVKSKSKQNGENRYYTEVYKLLVQSWKSVYDRFWA